MKCRVLAFEIPTFPVSWQALRGKLSRLNRLKVFDTDSVPRLQSVRPLRYKDMLKPGAVSVVDLSDSSMSELSNLVIADLLRGVQEEQDRAYEAFEKARRAGDEAAPPTRVLLIIEESGDRLISPYDAAATGGHGPDTGQVALDRLTRQQHYCH